MYLVRIAQYEPVVFVGVVGSVSPPLLNKLLIQARSKKKMIIEPQPIFLPLLCPVFI
jgi:hypothetical protein